MLWMVFFQVEMEGVTGRATRCSRSGLNRAPREVHLRGRDAGGRSEDRAGLTSTAGTLPQ